MGFQGYPFTWSNGREGDANVQLRLDRALSTKYLLLHFPYSNVSHGVRSGYDHSPLIISLDNVRDSTLNFHKPFRFEECWTKEPQCRDCIKDSWLEGVG